MAENMNTGALTLPKEVSSEIWQDAQEASAVMRFANRIALPGVGISVPMITGDPTAEWAGETDEITVGDSTLDSREMKGYKIGVIETFSKEFKRDLPGIYAELRRRLPKTLASKFDATVAFGTSTPVDQQVFDSFQKAGVQELPLTSATAYDDLVAIDQAVAEANGQISAYVLSPKARGVLLRAKDSSQRPLLVNNVQTDGAVNELLGVPTFASKAFYRAAQADPDGTGPQTATPEYLGLAGDWSNAYYGVVEDISVEVSDQATITKGGNTLNLWQRDMFAVKVTAHLGFMLRKGKEDTFVRVTA